MNRLWMDGWCVNGWVNKWMDRLVGGWMDSGWWMNGRMDECIDGWMNGCWMGG